MVTFTAAAGADRLALAGAYARVQLVVRTSDFNILSFKKADFRLGVVTHYLYLSGSWGRRMVLRLRETKDTE